MGSRVEPYFILTAEKVTNPRELDKLNSERLQHLRDKSPPLTPAPSGVSGNTARVDGFVGKRFQKRKKVKKYQSPVKELRQKDNLTKRMEYIKEKLEKSRERMNEQKQKSGDVDLKCEPGTANGDNGVTGVKLERSISDMGALAVPRKMDSSSNNPYVYFVVSEERLKEPTLVTESGERISSKSADKRRRVRIVEENRLKRDRKEKRSQSEKMKTLAREIGLKSEPVLKSTDGIPTDKPHASLNMIVFPGPDHESSRPTTRDHLRSSRVIHSPPKNPPCTPATAIQSELKNDTQLMVDVDDTVPRKPFLSSPMYNGKTKGLHSLSIGQFELPVISAEQKRRALGFGMTGRFEDFAYPKPQSEQRQRKVSFADQLPVIRGSGFVLSTGDNRDGMIPDSAPPLLGPRAVTMGSITLPSEQVDKQSMCHKYLAGENISAARTRKFGIPLALPKIDIVSNVYDEMIIKMIHEYLQDSNTPSRQSQLAKELLVHLQKHNEHMKELNVPNLDRTKIRLSKADMAKHQRKTQKLIQEIETSGAPPNTAENSEPLTPLEKEAHSEIPKVEEANDPRRQNESAGGQKNVPFVQITFKSNDNEDDGANEKTGDKLRARAKERPILSPVTPVTFQMAPPGLNKEDSLLSTVSLKA